MSFKIGFGVSLDAPRGRGAPPIITATTAPSLGALTDGDTLENELSADIFDLANYQSTAGDIVSVEVRAFKDGVDQGVISPLDPDAGAYINAVETADGQALEDGVKTAIDDFVVGLKTDGIWSALGTCAIYGAARTVNGALVGLVGPDIDNYGFGLADYARGTGFLGDGASKSLGVAYSLVSGNLNDQHSAVWRTERESVGVTQALLGNEAASGGNNSGLLYVTDTRTDFRCSNNFGNVSPADNGPGFHGAARQSSSTLLGRKNGEAFSLSEPSVSISTNTWSIFGRGPNGSPETYSDARISFHSIGAYVDLPSLEARVSMLMTDLDGAIA